MKLKKFENYTEKFNKTESISILKYGLEQLQKNTSIKQEVESNIDLFFNQLEINKFEESKIGVSRNLCLFNMWLHDFASKFFDCSIYIS